MLLSDKLIGSARTLKDVKQYVTRWDKCNLNEYYDASRVCIANVTVNTEYAWCTNNKCNDALHRHAITTHYSQIVEALLAPTKLSASRIQSNSLRPFWNSELHDLKSKSIFWHHVWKDAG